MIPPIQSRLKERQAAVSQLLIGGNHLASALIDWLGASTDKFPDYTTPPREARDIIKDVSVYDAWVCWAAIMKFRDIYRPEQAVKARVVRVG